MRILAVTDRLDGRGGAGRYWLDLMVWLATEHELRVVAGAGTEVVGSVRAEHRASLSVRVA